MVLDAPPYRIEIPGHLERTAHLAALRSELDRRMAEILANRIAILLPGSYDAGPTKAVARVAAETLLRMVAIEAGKDVELLARPRARKRVGLPSNGLLDQRLSELFPNPVGKYWAGRKYAALAAVACGKAV